MRKIILCSIAIAISFCTSFACQVNPPTLALGYDSNAIDKSIIYLTLANPAFCFKIDWDPRIAPFWVRLYDTTLGETEFSSSYIPFFVPYLDGQPHSGSLSGSTPFPPEAVHYPIVKPILTKDYANHMNFRVF